MKHAIALRTCLVVLALASLFYYVKLQGSSLGQTGFDDAYMFLRYAKHWLAGEGFCWNRNEPPAYGATSALHLIAVTAVRGLTRLDDPTVLTAISFLAGLVSCVVLVAMGFLIGPGFRHYWLSLLVIPCLVLGRLFPIHGLTGMETTLSLLANALFAASVWLCATRFTRTRLCLCLATAYASFLARPDAGIYCLFLPPLFFVASDRGLWRAATLYALWFALMLCGDLALKQAVLGDFVPLPFFAKSSGFYRGYMGAEKWNHVRECIVFLRDALPLILIVIALASRRVLARLLALFLPVLLTFGYLATVNQIMGWDARFYYPSLPFFALAAFICLESAIATARLETRPTDASALRGRAWRITLACAALTGLQSSMVERVASDIWRRRVIGDLTRVEGQTRYAIRARRELPLLGWWESIQAMNSLLSRLPGATVVAASEHGYIGSQHPEITIIDIVGLHDRHIARHGFSADYLFSRHPDLIWLPHSDYSYIVSEILDSKTFIQTYDFYRGAYDYGLAIRKEGELAPAIATALRHEFARLYPGFDMNAYRADAVTRSSDQGLESVPDEYSAHQDRRRGV